MTGFEESVIFFDIIKNNTYLYDIILISKKIWKNWNENLVEQKFPAS